MRTEWLSAAEALDRAPEWDVLHARASGSPFQSRSWQTAWWETFARRGRVRVLSVWDGDDLCAWLPLWFGVGVVRAAGFGVSDFLDPLLDPERPDAAGALVGELARLRTTVVVPDVRPGRFAEALAGAGWECEDQSTCLSLSLPDTYDRFLGGLSKSLRYDARAQHRMAFVGKGYSVEFASNLLHGYDALERLHRLRWRQRGQPGVFWGRTSRFHRRFLSDPQSVGVWMPLLLCRGEPVGAVYAFAVSGACWFYQAGFDPAHRSVSPGTVLIAALAERAIGEGLSRFEMLRGDEGYKRRWQPDEEFRTRWCMLPGRAAWAERARFAAEQAIKRKFEGGGAERIRTAE